MSSDSSYLDHLKFEPRLATGWIARYLKNFRIPILLIISIVLLGIASYTMLPKRLNPEVKIPIVTVITTVPGSNAADIEDLVTNPLEKQIKQLANITDLNSVSRDNLSYINIQFSSTVSPKDAETQTQSKVNQVSLPTNTESPTVKALDFEDQPIWLFALTGASSVELANLSQDLKNKLEDLSSINRVTISGAPETQINIRLDYRKLTQFQLNSQEVANLIRSSLKSLPAGTISSDNYQFSIALSPTITNIEQLRSLPLIINNQTVTLGSIAEVVIEPQPNTPSTSITYPGQTTQTAVVLAVYKNTNADIIKTGQTAKEAVNEYLKKYPSISLTTELDTSLEIEKQFSDLIDEFRTTILLVGGTLLLFLGLRQALISVLTIPLTFFATFTIMNMTGQSINFLSLFAFLLALGLLVDDTIVVVSAMTSYYRSNKFTPNQTGILVWKDTIVPIWSTTITTIWSFVPLLLSSGIIGEFIKPIPIVVTSTMISSTAIAVLITLPLMIIILKPLIPRRVKLFLNFLAWLIVSLIVIFATRTNPLFPAIIILYLLLTIIVYIARVHFATRIQNYTNQPKIKNFLTQASRLSDAHLISVEPFAQSYYRLIKRILANASSRRRIIIACVVYAVVCFSLLPLGLVKNEFFPKADSDLFYVQLKLPSGTNLATVESKSRSFLTTFTNLPYTEFITTQVGKSYSQQSSANDQTNQVLYTIKLVDEKKRPLKSFDIAEHLRTQFRDYPDQIQIIELTSGPPAGAEVQLTFLGNDLLSLDQTADQAVAYLKSQPGITNPGKSLNPGTSQLSFRPNLIELRKNGITPDQIALSIAGLTRPQTLGTIKLSQEPNEVPIVFDLTGQPAHLDRLNQITIRSSTGINLPLSALGTWVAQESPQSISHYQGQRAVTVTASLRPGASGTEANSKLLNTVKSWQLPEGVTYVTGGINEENAKSVQSILLAMILAVILILVTMVLQFSSFRAALIVLLVIPLAVSSVFLIFALTQTPLSFPALIGILSLFGIVVTNSMFIVDKINLNLKQGMIFEDAIADAGASRMEPIILTKLSTVLGLLPITLADPLWRGLGGAIISGLLIASTIMLLFIPVVAYAWLKPKSIESTI